MFRTPLIVILVGSVLTAGCFGSEAHSGRGSFAGADHQAQNVSLELMLEQPSGARAFRVAASEVLALEYEMSFEWSLTDYAPVQILFVYPNGTVETIVAGLEYDAAHWGRGDGVVYAGASGESAESPAVSAEHTSLAGGRRLSLAGEGGMLLLMWANQKGPIEFVGRWNEGAIIEDLGTFPAGAAEMKDFAGGVHAGTPLAAAHVADQLTLEPENGALFGSITYIRGNAGQGRLDLTSEDFSERISLDGKPGVQQGVLTYEQGRAFFGVRGDARLALEFLGNGEDTKIFLLYADLPPGLTPMLWQDALLKANPA